MTFRSNMPQQHPPINYNFYPLRADRHNDDQKMFTLSLQGIYVQIIFHFVYGAVCVCVSTLKSCAAFLTLCQTNTIHVNGSGIDGDEKDAEAFIMPQKRQTKKINSNSRVTS